MKKSREKSIKTSPTATRVEISPTKNSKEGEKEEKKEARKMRMSKEIDGKDVRLANHEYPPLSVGERKKILTLDKDVCSLLEAIRIQLDCVESAIDMVKPGVVDGTLLDRLDWLSAWHTGTSVYLNERRDMVEIISDK